MRRSLLSAFLVFALVACAPAQAPSVSTGGSGAPSGPNSGGSEVKLGAVLSLTSGAAIYGSVQKQGIELAVEEINRTRFLGDRRLSLVVEDDRSVKEGAISAFEKLINQDKVVAILGPTLSNSALASDPIAQEKKVVVLGVSNTANGITEIGDYIFRNSLPESVVQPNTIKITKEKLNYRRVAVLYGDDDAFTKSAFDTFKKALEDNGVQIVATETFKKGDTDFSAQMTKIRGTNPDAIVTSALAEEAAGMLVQARQLGIGPNVPFIGGNGLNTPQIAKLAGAASDGVITGAAWFVTADTPANQAFVKAFKEKYNQNPDQFAAQAYTGVYLIANAIKNANAADSKSIRDSLVKIQNLDTALGRFSFTSAREPVHPPVVQIMKNGQFELFK